MDLRTWLSKDIPVAGRAPIQQCILHGEVYCVECPEAFLESVRVIVGHNGIIPNTTSCFEKSRALLLREESVLSHHSHWLSGTRSGAGTGAGMRKHRAGGFSCRISHQQEYRRPFHAVSGAGDRLYTFQCKGHVVHVALAYYFHGAGKALCTKHLYLAGNWQRYGDAKTLVMHGIML